MQAACEAGDVFSLLEGGAGGARAAGDALAALYQVVREPWLVRALLLYHARTGSQRALELLARAPEPHARHALDALGEQLRAPERTSRWHALSALALLLARRAPWHHLLLPPSPLPRELVRAARRETEPGPRLNALLALAALLPGAPALAAPLAPELAELLTRGGPPASPHLALGQRSVFLALYALAPCSLLEAWRGAGAELGGAARASWEGAVEALARGVQLHPALVTGSRRAEADGARWSRAMPHDVLHECHRLALPPPPPAPAEPPPPTPLPAAPSPAPTPPAPPGSGAQAARSASALRPGGEGWWSLGERTGAEAAPHTPLPEREPEPEPEPAVEATPENTPARQARQAFRFPAPDSPAARAIGRTPPPGGAGAGAAPAHGDACAARLARVAAERRAQDSPVPMGGAPPVAAARPMPRPAAAPGAAPPDDRDEDREVRELTARALGSGCAWGEAEAGGGGGELRARLAPLAPAAAPARPPRRARSAPPPAGGRARRDAAAQTHDAWPEPCEFLVADLFAALPDTPKDKSKSTQSETTPTERFIRGYVGDGSERLDRYLGDLYAGGPAPAPAPGAAAPDPAEQLALAHAQIMYERWRRDAHDDFNRRLLGRCRKVRKLELDNLALEERVRALTRERDALRLRAAAPPPAPAAPAAPSAQEAALERALHEERAGRLRAEAAWRAAEAVRARDAAELQRTRGESFEAARHVEALARAALAAERRAEHVRRLRRELLLLGEREARLAGAVSAALRAPPPEPSAERALRAALGRAEADAEAAALRAEAAGARTHELEAALGAREAALAELKRSARAQQEEGGARLGALHDKYAALLRVVRAAAARELELRARAPPAAREELDVQVK